MITASTNPKVKNLINLVKKGKARKEQDVFVAEGSKMFMEADPGRIREVWLSHSFFLKLKEKEDIREKLALCRVEVLADSLFERVSDTGTPQGILCVIRQYHYDLDELLKREKPLLLLLEDIQDPGNLGTMLRTAEGAGADGVIMSKGTVDIYNPKTIRSTMGSVYRVPFFYTESLPEIVHRLHQKRITVYAAHLRGERAYYQEDFSSGCAFLIGNEAKGLKEETARAAGNYMKIPMRGRVESLNAATATSILLYEAVRQRNMK
ncbi:MAG: TrmH family RNA methyltransferase [Lachnospiraceae bacterium]